MLGDRIVDPQTGREYVVSWDGSRQCGPLLDRDPDYARQRAYAKDAMTAHAVVNIGIRPDQVKCDVEVDTPWQ